MSALPDARERLEVLRSTIHSAGQLALDYFDGRRTYDAELKGTQDWVSRADRDVEAAIRASLSARFPADGFLGEESVGDFDRDLGRGLWIVDPIDGTHNFVRGVRYWCVSIGYWRDGVRHVGAVYDPCHDELFIAARGQGAHSERGNTRTRLTVADCSALNRAFVCLGHHDRSPDPRYLAVRDRMMASGVAMRNMGAGALQLCHVAAGRYDGFIELYLSAWDACAGLVVIEEAGGFSLPYDYPNRREGELVIGGPVLACAPAIAAELTALAGLGPGS